MALLRKIGGGITTLLSAWGWISVASKLFGLPGYIDDAAQWLEWAGVLDDQGFPFLGNALVWRIFR